MKSGALIGDLIHSRRITDRARLQARIEELLDLLNREYGERLAARWAVTIGDEFQALARDAQPLPAMVDRLVHELHPHGIRFGIGCGGISTPLKPTAVGMDGPAFHAARLAVERAREGRHRVVVAAGGRVLDLPTHGWDLPVGGRTRSHGGPTPSGQRGGCRELGRQADVAARLGVSQGTVSILLRRALHAEVEAVLADLPRLLERASRGDIP